MKLADYLNSVDIGIIAGIEKRFSLGISPVTRNKVFSKIGKFQEFYLNILNGYDNGKIKVLINAFFEGNRCGIECNSEENEKEFLIKDLWGYITDNSEGCRFLFFREAMVFLKEYVNSLVFSQADNSGCKGQRVNLFSFIDSFILMLGTGKYKAIRGGVTKSIINDIIQKTGYTNKFFIKFAYCFLLDQGIIKEDSNFHIVTDIATAQTWNKIDNFAKIETVINYMCSKYIVSLFNKRDNICISLASYLFSIDSPPSFGIEKTTYFLSEIMNVPGKSVADFMAILESSELLIRDKDNFVKSDIYKFLAEQDARNSGNTGDDLFYIQPNFEIIVSFMCESEISLYLSRFAELISYDRAVIFRITKKSFTRAISSGMKANDIISFIKEKSRNPVPENVVFNLMEWEKEVVSIVVENVNIIRFKDDFLRDKIISLDEIESQIVGKISDNCFIIKEIESVNEILLKNGYFSESSTKLSGEGNTPFSGKEKILQGNGFDDSQEAVLPKFARKFKRSQRLCSLSQEEKIKAFKYALIKDFKVELIYWCPQDKQLHNRKCSVQVFEVSNSWRNPDVYVYIEDLKRNYSLNISDVKRMRVVL